MFTVNSALLKGDDWMLAFSEDAEPALSTVSVDETHHDAGLIDAHPFHVKMHEHQENGLRFSNSLKDSVEQFRSHRRVQC